MAFLKSNKTAFIQIGTWLLLLAITVFISKVPFVSYLNNSLWNICFHGLLAVAMIATVNTSAGLNLGIPIGTICGHLAVILVTYFSFAGLGWLMGALIIALALAAIVGFGYGKLLSKIKGSGGTNLILTCFIGIFAVKILNLLHSYVPGLILPVSANHPMINPEGIGLRNNIALPEGIMGIFSNFLRLNIGGVSIPCGLLLFLAIVCFVVWYFLLRDRRITNLEHAEQETKIAFNKGKYTLIAAMISTVICALFTIVYAQNVNNISIDNSSRTYVFEIFPAILLGGVTLKKASIRQAIMGVLLYDAVIVLSVVLFAGLAMQGPYIRSLIPFVIIVCAIFRSLWRSKSDKEQENESVERN